MLGKKMKMKENEDSFIYLILVPFECHRCFWLSDSFFDSGVEMEWMWKEHGDLLIETRGTN